MSATLRPATLPLLAGIALFAVTLAGAAPSPPRSEPPKQAQPSATSANPGDAPDSEEAERARALAAGEYKKGYKDSEEAKKLKKSGKADQAKGKFTKALVHFEEAVKLNEPYAEAWNMIGFCRRNLGDMRKAFDAYDRSLAINPDLEEAHEYLGELYAMSGMLEKAREHLAWLTAKKSDEAEELAEAIEAAEKAKPKAGAAAATAATTPAAATAPSDSSAADSTKAR